MQPDSCSVLTSRLQLTFSFLIAALLIFPVVNVNAAAPVNDRCAFAIVIPTNGPFPHLTASVDITEATVVNDPPLPSCQTDVSRSVWYTFRPQATDVYHLATCGDAGTGTTVRDTIIAIYTASNGCGTTYTEIAGGCNDDACNKQSAIATILTAGVTYYIVVWQYGTNVPPVGQGLVQLLVERGRPQNEDCNSPQEVQLNIPVMGNTLYGRNDYDFGNSVCFQGIGHTAVDTPGLDVVFAFTAPTADNYSFRVKNYNIAADPNYDLVIYVSETCPLPDPKGSMNDCIKAANRNLGIAEAIVDVPLPAGKRVYLFVDDRYAVNRGSRFMLEVTHCTMETGTNSSPFDAAPMIFEITGSINPVNETDYFALGTFTPGSRAFALIDAVAANIPDFDLRVVNTTDTLEYDSDNNDIPFGQNSANIAGTPLTADGAWLRVSHVPVISEPYRLYAVVQPPSSNATPEVEPNSTLGQAQSSPKNYISGYLPGPADEDYYAFQATAGDLIFMGLDADPLRDRSPIDAQLELLNSFGSILLVVDDEDSLSVTNTTPGVWNAIRPRSPAESLVYRAPYTGQYYARVSISPFALVATNMIGDYLLSISRNGFIGTGATNIPPIIGNISAPTVGNDTNAVLSATISDPDAGPKFTVVISWGDGSPNTTLALDVGQYSFEAPHRYTNAGVYPISLTAFDLHGGAGSAITSIQVTNTAAGSARMRSIRNQPDGSMVLEMEGTPNATYRIQFSENLQNWTNLTTRTADAAGRFQLTDVPPLPPRRFYRAVWP